ncbi:PR domain zinc finger protein 2 [Sceloporus undulatus]|uniref:PR domain zinc finger protein 2 n=1 Tax=Sceloporus undulatus TaxID=8520 RepID=UPI001C4BC4EF|nr:PR domain zinc finger protein 2 [Sceloporus undulatus]XP_042335099.1 PR domain zinc finger protein 2 [Sceloporus undulatus]XP_042335100.1 PR domain zinc finger protein 2 [Sceloporus undulatus]
MNQNSIEPPVSVETLADVPEHVLKGLPEEVRLLPSAVDKTRLGVWATKPIFRGRKFGPFVGDKKKRSQVKSNVYMWEVYYPNLGWMCVDATDPAKGNWLRYVNWARSGKEQNLFPLEINRTIYYKTLKPIEPGEELLVWYNGEDNPAIAAAIEEERASNRSKRNSPKAKKGKKKSQEAKSKGKKATDKKQETVLDLTLVDMREPNEGHKEEEDTPSVSAVLSLEQTAVIQEMVNQDALPGLVTSSPASEPHASPANKPNPVTCELDVAREQEEESEDGEDSEDDMEDEEEEEEEGEPEEEEEDVEVPTESPNIDPLSICEDKLDFVEDLSSMSEDSPESSPKKRPGAKFPKARGEANSVHRTFMFPCQHCERKFTTKQGLERHMHIHISAISHAFKCRYCGKAFGTQINRRRHERRHEAGPKRKPFTTVASAQTAEGDASNPRTAEDGAKEETNARPNLTPTEPDKLPAEMQNPVPTEESKETKELHPCNYCRKVFGTHTNMRRHQRRVHERHLIPKGVRRKAEEPQPPVEQTPEASNVYVASSDLEEEAEGDDVYIMDVSSNISENLNYYIDGKIQSNSSTSNCDVIEVESSSTELYGINCLLSPVTVEIAPNIKATPVQLTEVAKESPLSGSAELKKRRTTSPLLLPKIKTELDLEPITSLCSLTIPLTISTAESLPFPKEKSIYLSSKLKQLLQTQDGNKVVPSPPLPSTEMPKLGHPAGTSPLLPTASSRFKRRTSSPPSSPQHSPALRDFGKGGEGKPVWNDAGLGSKIPKLESHSNSPAWSLSGREEKETMSPLCLEEYKTSKDWAPSPPFGNVCNQQPLDLSSSMKQRTNGKNQGQVSWESVLDLSVHKKPCNDTEAKESNVALPSCSSVKKKPTTSMLQKVLLNEYNGTEPVSENPIPETINLCPLAETHLEPEADAGLLVPVLESGSPKPSTDMPLPPASIVPSCQVPPLLTPTNSPSPPPCPPMLKVPTPPPPLLPTVHSPLPEEPISITPNSCPSPLSNTTAQSPLPILSPTISASPIPSVEPLSCASPGPPTLSSSSSSSSFSSSSSSSSSSSPSPPPLSVVSSVLSPGDNLENSVPIMSFKQEEVENEHQKLREDQHHLNEADPVLETFNKSFVCNVCESPFLSIKDLTKHLLVHAEEWPFKCEFCVQLFREKTDLSEHRFLLHGVGNIFVCSVCKKEFAFLCNLQQHQRDLHPDKECTHHEFESGTLRPQNFTDPSKANVEHMQSLPDISSEPPKEEEEDEELNDSSEELYTTIKIMASGVKSRNPDVRMGLNQHYPSFKPPPFQYHHRNPNGIGVTATNFTTHNIPQTFTTAIRCTKCGKSVDNMPELHKHILACASASDKKRYTPKKNPVPLKQTVRPKNGIVLPSPAGNAFRRMGQPKRLSFNVEVSRMSSSKLKLSALKKKNQLVQKAILQKKKSQQKAELKNNAVEPSSHICPYCNREFTYIGSLNKHASYSCPKKPLSPSSKKKARKKSGKGPSSSSEKSGNQRRRTADAEIKMQSTQAHLGKTRARSSGPLPIQLPSASFKIKQNIKLVPAVKSKKSGTPSAAKNASSVRVTKMVSAEGKKPKGLAKNSPSGHPSKGPCKLHVRIQRNKVALTSKGAVASKKKRDRFSAKSRKRVGGPVTRSLQQASGPEGAENKKEEASARQEPKDFRSLL